METNAQQQTNVTDATTQPEAAEPAELDLTALLVKDDAPAETAATEGADDTSAAATAETTEAGKTDATDETTPVEGEGEGEGAAATTTTAVDPTAVKAQADFAAAAVKLTDLMEKIQSGEKLSAAEQQQAQTVARKAQTIRDALKGKDFDVLDHAEALAEALIEADDANQTLAQQLAATNKRLDAMEQQTAAQQAEADWAQARQTYPGVDVKAVWQKSITDSLAMAGVKDPAKLPADSPVHEAIANVAHNLFHQRSDAAAKAVAAKKLEQAGKPGGLPAAPKPKAGATTLPPKTPGGARVAQASGNVVTEPSDDSAYVQRAVALVKD